MKRLQTCRKTDYRMNEWVNEGIAALNMGARESLSFRLLSPVWRNPRRLFVEPSGHPLVSLIVRHPVVLAVMSLLMMLVTHVIMTIIRSTTWVTCIAWCFSFPLVFLFSMTFILLAASQWFFILFEIYFTFQNSRAHPFYCFIISCKSKMPYHWLLLKIPINYVCFLIYIVPWL